MEMAMKEEWEEDVKRNKIRKQTPRQRINGE